MKILSVSQFYDLLLRYNNTKREALYGERILIVNQKEKKIVAVAQLDEYLGAPIVIKEEATYKP